MDLLAALALVVLLEGLVLAVFADRARDLAERMVEVPQGQVRNLGILCVVFGAAAYILIRSGSG